MQIKIDPEKDTIENLDIVAKIITELRKSKNVNTEEKPKQIKKKQVKKKQIRLSKAELFLVKKYSYYIVKTIIELSHRKMSPVYIEDGPEKFIKKTRKPEFSEIYIGEVNLFKSFAENMKQDNIHDANPFLFKKALDRMVNRSFFSFEKYGAQFHIEKIKNMLRILF